MKAAPWFRWYRNMVHKAKVRRLPPVLFKQWVMLLCLTDDDGKLPSLDDTADGMRISVERLTTILERLAERHFFEENADGWVAHNWGDYQYKSDHSRDRQQASRERHTGRHSDGGRDGPEQNRTETEQRQSPDPPSSDQAHSAKPLQAKQAFFDAPNNRRVARLVDLGDALGFQRHGGLVAGIWTAFGYNPQRVVDVMFGASAGAKGNPWKYVMATLREMEARDGGSGQTRSSASRTSGAGSRTGTGQARGWQAVADEMALGARKPEAD